MDRVRRRSVGFLEREGESWACYLATFEDGDGAWRGYFSFRPRDSEGEGDEVRTADIFVETSEPEIHRKARSLGRPLLSGLLSSALYSSVDSGEPSARLRRWFRELLTENSRELTGSWEAAKRDEDLPDLRSLYSSYRLDQVAHFIALVSPDDFDSAVAAVLEGTPIDFAGKDRLQLAMMVVHYIEDRLPLPPYEVWLEDYMRNSREYRLYAHTLHREGRFP